MDLYSKKSKSIPQKLVLLLLELIIILASYWILFLGGFDVIFKSNIIAGNETRHWILLIFNAIVFMRIIITMFWASRKMPWEEVFTIPLAFGIYYIGFALLGYRNSHDLDWFDYLAVAIFLFGSFLNTFSEYQRRKWKKLPENKGHLYTKGLFRYSMHINYFGDLLWVIGYAMISQNWYSLIIVAFVFSFFAFFNIPMLDKHLAEKYSSEFDDFKKKTKKFIPFIY